MDSDGFDALSEFGVSLAKLRSGRRYQKEGPGGPRQESFDHLDHSVAGPVQVLQNKDDRTRSSVGADESGPGHGQFDLYRRRTNFVQWVSRDGDPGGEGKGKNRLIDGRLARRHRR